MHKDLLDFIKRESFDDNIIITGDTRLVSDLGINKDDAVEFVIKYGKEFDVDVSEFPAAEYFESEGADIIDILSGIYYFFHKMITGKEKVYPLKELTVADLEKGIREGKLC